MSSLKVRALKKVSWDRGSFLDQDSRRYGLQHSITALTVVRDFEDIEKPRFLVNHPRSLVGFRNFINEYCVNIILNYNSTEIDKYTNPATFPRKETEDFQFSSLFQGNQTLTADLFRGHQSIGRRIPIWTWAVKIHSIFEREVLDPLYKWVANPGDSIYPGTAFSHLLQKLLHILDELQNPDEWLAALRKFAIANPTIKSSYHAILAELTDAGDNLKYVGRWIMGRILLNLIPVAMGYNDAAYGSNQVRQLLLNVGYIFHIIIGDDADMTPIIQSFLDGYVFSHLENDCDLDQSPKVFLKKIFEFYQQPCIEYATKNNNFIFPMMTKFFWPKDYKPDKDQIEKLEDLIHQYMQPSELEKSKALALYYKKIEDQDSIVIKPEEDEVAPKEEEDVESHHSGDTLAQQQLDEACEEQFPGVDQHKDCCDCCADKDSDDEDGPSGDPRTWTKEVLLQEYEKQTAQCNFESVNKDRKKFFMTHDTFYFSKGKVKEVYEYIIIP